MKKIVIGVLRKKEYKGLVKIFRKLFKKDLTYWVGEFYKKDIPLTWDIKNKIDDTFDGRSVGFEFIYKGKKQFLNIVTFYPDNFKKIYPELVSDSRK